MSSILICYNRNGKNMIEIKNEWRDLRRIDMKRTDVMKGSALKPRTVGRKHSRPLVRSLMFCNAAVCVVLQQHQYHSSLTAPCLSTRSLSLSHLFSHYLLPSVAIELNFWMMVHDVELLLILTQINCVEDSPEFNSQGPDVMTEICQSHHVTIERDDSCSLIY